MNVAFAEIHVPVIMIVLYVIYVAFGAITGALTELSVWVCPQCVSIKCDTGKGKCKKGRKGIGKFYHLG